MATSVLSHPEGEVHIDELARGQRRLTVRCSDPSRFVPIATCETSYPPELIELTLEVTGIAWLCEAIARDEDPSYVREELRVNLFGFVAEEDFRGKRLLDFGCGAGASTVWLGELLPDTEIVGVELDAKLLALGRARARHRGLRNVRFEASPDGNGLPSGIGAYDFCMMSAVYEHLLPKERVILMPKIWNTLRPDGVLFINQTPHRYFPIETHSTRLPLINYLPDALAFAAARRLAPASNAVGQTNEQLLRGGVRGATEREIRTRLASDKRFRPVLLEPIVPGCRDRIDLWYSRLSKTRYPRAKSALRHVLKVVRWTTGTVLTQNLTLAVRKQPRRAVER
jgi:SAM-dependent methyltransferase